MKRILPFVFLMLCASSAPAAPFQNGGFEIGTPTADPCNISLPIGSTAITGWTVIVGDVDYVVGCWTSSEGARSLDLVGAGSKGGIQQTFDTVVGQAYEVNFDLAGNPSAGFPPSVKRLTASVDDGGATIFTRNYNFDTALQSPAALGWSPTSFTFVATSASSTLSFVSDMTGSTFAGAALDNVKVVAIPPGGWTAGNGTVIGGGASPYPPSSPLVCASSQWSYSGETFFYQARIDAFGVQGPVIASYAVPQGNTTSGICGSWTATAVAAATGSVDVHWDYSANHSSFNVTADLQAVVIRGGSPLPPTLLATYRGPPGGPFQSSGQYTFNLLAGDVFGFAVTGSNFDFVDAMSGTIYVTGIAPSSVALASAVNPASSGTPVALTATVTGTNPRGTVSFTDSLNEVAGCAAVPLVPVSATQSTASCIASPTAVGVHTISAQYSGDMANRVSITTLGQVTTAGGPSPTPVLIRALPSGSAVVPLLIARADGAVSTPVTVQLFGGTSCVDGVLGGTIGKIGADAVPTTDANGYFGTSQGGAQGQFVAVKLTTPVVTPLSNCVVTSADNDTWPKALRLTGATVSVPDWIDAPGKARWYRFSIVPGQSVQVTLAGLPADYDLAVFKDIAAAFASELAPATTEQLTKLSSQYAPSAFSPSAFSPSAFSPSAFSPSAFSPSAFSPSAFSPSAFSPSAFSPSAFSPSAFSPSAFSPSAFSPSAFSPSAFSPSAFSPSAFSPSAFSPAELNAAFSSAQTRSIIAASMSPGVANESVVVNTWNNTGDFYVRVTGRAGAYAPSPYTLAVATQGVSCVGVAALVPVTRTLATTGYTTIVLVDSSKTPLSSVLGTGGTLQAKLEAFAQRPDVNGIVVDVDADGRVRALRSQAASHPGCPYAKNLVALEIKSIVDTYAKRTTMPRLAYVVIAGNDDAIPFFRYPDQSLLGQESAYIPPVSSNSASEASLRRDYVLSQDAYGARTQISLRSSDFPIPGLAVGRLIETPDEIAGMIDAYVAANGVVSPTSSLVTGYDFLQDAADAVTNELKLGTGQNPDTLITPATVSPADTRTYANGGPWTASDLRLKLASRHDVMFLAGHFNANSTLAADFKTSMITSELALSANLTNALVFSAGCHAGYNLVDTDGINGVTFPLDWAQAFAQRKATLVAGTGYQYGDTDFIEYSERLYLDFAKELRAGQGKVAIGDALVRAKLAYLATTPDIRGLHEKALLEATLFGLPMMGVDMPSGRTPVATNIGVIDTVPPATPGPATTLGLRLADLSVSPIPTAVQTRTLTNYEVIPPATTTATWYSGPDGVVTQPAEPTLPLKVVDVTPKIATLVLRGVGFVGGTYADSTVLPLTGAPTTELRGVHTPFASPLFFPMRLFTSNYFSTLSGGGKTNLLVTPAQHRALDAANSTLRLYSSLDVRLYYSDLTTTSNPVNAAAVLSDAPTIVSVDAMPIAGMATFVAQVVGNPAAGMHDVWVTYTDAAGGNGSWTSKSMQQCVAPIPVACGTLADSQYWVTQVPLAQLPADTRYVVQAVNGVGLVSLDDNLGRYYSLGGAAAPAATTMAFGPPLPASAHFGDTVTVSATLFATAPVAGKLVTIGLGGSSRTATTSATGSATVQLPVLSAPGTYPLTASFAGDAAYAPAAISAPTAVVVDKASTVLTTPATGVGVILTGSVGSTPQPLAQESIQFLVSGPQGVQQVFALTDYTGRATIPPPGFPAGNYTVIQACFAGNSTFAASQLRSSPACGYRFTGFFQPVDNLPIVNVLKAGQAVPVKFSLGGNRGLAIFDKNSPGSQQVVCGTNGTTSDVDQISTAGASGLQYDATTDQYTYVWKTDKAWASTCRMLVMTLNDGSQYRASFQFK